MHAFDLVGHPTATYAYAWSSPIEGSAQRRFFAVLHTARINSPVEAVRAAIVAEDRRTHIVDSLSITNIALFIGAIVLLLIVIKLLHDIVSHWMNTRN